MTPKYKTFADALTATPATGPMAPAKPVAANDNSPKKRVRNNTTLPALRWLYDNHPDLAEPVASAVKSLARTEWEADAVDSDLEFRPTVGELVRAATDSNTDEWHKPTTETDSEGKTYIRLGELKFDGNNLVEYGRTRKGRRLEPRERMAARSNASGDERNPNGYIFGLKGAARSPLHAAPYQRPISGEPALMPMYDPQRGVEANRALLRSYGVDGSVPFDRLPFPATKCPTAIANGAEFIGGVVGSSGNASSGAPAWEAREMPKGEARWVIEEVAARGTLQSLGGGSIEAGKEALLNAARILKAANDNKNQKSCAA